MYNCTGQDSVIPNCSSVYHVYLPKIVSRDGYYIAIFMYAFIFFVMKKKLDGKSFSFFLIYCCIQPKENVDTNFVGVHML